MPTAISSALRSVMAKASRPLIVENIALSRWLHREGASARAAMLRLLRGRWNPSAGLYNDSRTRSFSEHLVSK
jgi:hypothetical protein